MRVLVCGDRHWNSLDRTWTVLYGLHSLVPITRLIEGEANGADKLGRTFAELNGIKVLPFPADWTKFGKAAGPMRNEQMIREGHPNLVIGFHNDIASSKGTKDMLKRAFLNEIPTRLVTDQIIIDWTKDPICDIILERR